jgi:hypothetical protein
VFPVVLSRDLHDPLLEVPSEMRPRCASLLEGSVPVGPGDAIEHPAPDAPFALFGRTSIPLQLYALAPGSVSPGRP